MPESRRIETLEDLGILYTGSTAFDRICFLATEGLGFPISTVSFLYQDEQWFKAAVGLQVRSAPRAHSFCQEVIKADGVLVVPDAAKDFRFRPNPLVDGPPYIRTYAGAPIIYAPGLRLGAVCIIDTAPREITARHTAFLETLALICVDQLRLVKASRLARHSRAAA
ncbi:GAF domain-containing protein [Alsobacter soli]|nr:GAF domain-containing protein [Alsobacter soli]